MTVEQWLGEDNKLGIDIWKKKYQYKGETFEEWLDRVSGGDEELRQLIKERKFLFGGRVLSNRGTMNRASYSNCFTSGRVGDSYEEIMDVARNIGLTFKAQGGQGLSLSEIRPKGTPIGKNEYYSDGIIPFMRIYNEITKGTSQGGARKGALLMSLDAWHKEAESFIKIKTTDGEIEKANLSLEVNDAFMRAVIENKTEISVKRSYSGHDVEYTVNPVALFHMLADSNYDWGEPGCLFIDRMREYHMLQHHSSYKIECVNPCAEFAANRGSACCLGSINLSEFVRNPFTGDAIFDYEGFEHAVRVATTALDEIIDENYLRYPLKEQQQISQKYRHIGLGVFGYASALMKLGLKYGSDDALEFTDKLFDDMYITAVKQSSQNAKEKGSFPEFEESMFDSDIFQLHMKKEDLPYLGMRNCVLISIAPTGSIGTMMDESGGIEPQFALQFQRRTVGLTNNEDKYYTLYCKTAKEYMKLTGNTELPDYFVCAEDVPWRDRIKTQSVIQNHVDNAISSTINVPENISKEDVYNIYIEAWKQGLKGVTLFRANCKRMAILTAGTGNEDNSKELKRGEVEQCSNDLIGLKRKIMTGCGPCHLLAFYDISTGKARLQEVYLNRGSRGGCTSYMVATSRLISLACRSGVSVYDIQDQLDSCLTCPSYVRAKALNNNVSKGASCPQAIGNALLELQEEIGGYVNSSSKLSNVIDNNKKEELINESTETLFKVSNIYKNETICPQCGETLDFESGCRSCHSCGYSKCS